MSPWGWGQCIQPAVKGGIREWVVMCRDSVCRVRGVATLPVQRGGTSPFIYAAAVWASRNDMY